jgi:hypothetical protein
MEQTIDKTAQLHEILVVKGQLKQLVYSNTYNVFSEFKSVIIELTEDLRKRMAAEGRSIPIEFRDRGEFELEMKFAGDILLFMMHTNVFEFSRDHEVMRTSYIREYKDRSYCGVINIYNFLADSFKYRRMNDIGYLIGRVFINKDLHYFIEGKREIGLLYNNFDSAIINREAINNIITSAMLYTINFDLLTPPYDSVKEVSVAEMLMAFDNMKIRTGKRLGYRFQSDSQEFAAEAQLGE